MLCSASGLCPGLASHCGPQGNDPEGQKPLKNMIVSDNFVKSPGNLKKLLGKLRPGVSY